MAARSTNTMSEVLTSIIGLISEAKLMPDADIPWLLSLETQVVQKARAPFESAMGAGGGGGMGDPNLGGPGAGEMPGGAPGGGMPGGGGDIASLLGLGAPGPSTPPTTVGPPSPGMSSAMPAPMTGMRGGGGGGDLGEVQRIMGAGPPRGARY